MIIEILGSGTSTGVPVPGCTCKVCVSDEPKNKRLRTSVYIQIQRKDIGELTPSSGEANEIVGRILIDSSTDLRQQALRAGISRVDAVLYTHTHADHIFGIDDLRSFNFVSRSTIPLYASSTTAADLKSKFSYCFGLNEEYEGGAPPRLVLNEIAAPTPFTLFGFEIIPLRLWHGSMEVYGYRLGSFAYLTDCSVIPEETRTHLDDLEVLVLDGLRDRPHRTHFTHQGAVAEVEKIKPRQTYLTHISHEVDHFAANKALEGMSEQAVEVAYDGLRIEL